MSNGRFASSTPARFDVPGFLRSSETRSTPVATADVPSRTSPPARNLEGTRSSRATSRRFQTRGFRRLPRRCRTLRETPSNRSFGRRPVGVTRTLSVGRSAAESRTRRNRGDSPGFRTVPSACIRFPRGPSRPSRRRRRRRRRSTLQTSEVGDSPLETPRSSTTSRPAPFMNYPRSDRCPIPDDAFVPRRSTPPSRESRESQFGGTRSRSHRRSCEPLAYRDRRIQPSRKLVGPPISFDAVERSTPSATSTRPSPPTHVTAPPRREGPGSTPGRRHFLRTLVSRNKYFRRFP